MGRLAPSAGRAPVRCAFPGAAASAPLPLRPPGPPAGGRSRGGAGGDRLPRSGAAAGGAGPSLSRRPRPARLERLSPRREGVGAKAQQQEAERRVLGRVHLCGRTAWDAGDFRSL